MGTDASQVFTVINAGVRAYGTDQEVTFFRRTGPALQPDLVLLCIYINDLELTGIERNYLYAMRMNNGAPYFFDLKMPNGVKARLLWEGVQFLRLSRVLMLAHDLLVARWGADRYEMRLIAGVVNDDIRHRMAGFRQQLETFKNLLSVHRVAGLSVIIPAPEQVRNRALPPLYQELVTRAAREAGLPVIDLLPAFRERFPDRLPVLAYDPHYDASAHALIAETLAPAVTELFAEHRVARKTGDVLDGSLAADREGERSKPF